MENTIDKVDVGTKTIVFYFVKRIFDIIVGILGLIILIPITIIVKLINILNKDFAPVFYSHTRIGKNGKEFKLYKFRSMVPNADEVLKELLKDEKYATEWKENQKFEDDPRITKIGKILRKTSLDEVPQFLNILKGDMSLIGPRPLLKGELEQHNGDPLIYQKVRPGITGWWACNGRSATTYDERLKLEYYYVNNMSFSMDIKCIFKTIVAVLKRDGAK